MTGKFESNSTRSFGLREHINDGVGGFALSHFPHIISPLSAFPAYISLDNGPIRVIQSGKVLGDMLLMHTHT